MDEALYVPIILQDESIKHLSQLEDDLEDSLLGVPTNKIKKLMMDELSENTSSQESKYESLMNFQDLSQLVDNLKDSLLEVPKNQIKKKKRNERKSTERSAIYMLCNGKICSYQITNDIINNDKWTKKYLYVDIEEQDIIGKDIKLYALYDKSIHVGKNKKASKLLKEDIYGPIIIFSNENDSISNISVENFKMLL